MVLLVQITHRHNFIIKNKNKINQKKDNKQKWDIPCQLEGGEKASTVEMASVAEIALAAEITSTVDMASKERALAKIG